MSDSTKKATAPKRAAVPKKPSQHPAYKDMISEAIRSLKERNGSSRQKIAKFLETNYNYKHKYKTAFLKATTLTRVQLLNSVSHIANS